MGTKHRIEVLAVTVGIVPIGFALHVDVGTQDEVAHEARTKVEAVIGHG